MSDTKRIAKNTMFMYIRMLFIMGVSLYTSRVVLDKLGVDDFGLYNVVGGVVGMLSFISGTLSTGTSRFITFDLGKNDLKSLNITFNTTFYAHVSLGLLFVLLLETGGIWYIYNKLVVEPERFNAALIVFQVSIIAALIGIIQVPFSSLIMAHEDMSVYAYVGIFDAVGRLLVVFLLSYAPCDKLVFYAILLMLVQLSVAMCYYAYCRSHYCESKTRLVCDKKVLKSLLGFSGWNIMANLSETLNSQGILVLINLFFAPYVVASQAIAAQVSNAMTQFVNNFRTAINPQIIKLYASGDKEDSKKLTLDTTVLCFDMVLLLGLPAIVVMDKLMDMWLVEVPPYAVIFAQWIIARQVLGTFSASFYIPMMAANKMKVNSLTAAYSGIGSFLVLYLLFKMGLGPMWIQYVGLICTLLYSFVVKPYVLYKDIDYKIKEMASCYWKCAKVAFFSCLIAIPSMLIIGDSLGGSFLKASIAFLAVVFSSYMMMEKTMKEKIYILIKEKVFRFVQE